MIYAERGLNGHGGGFESAGRTAGQGGLFRVPCEIDHDYKATGSAGGFRAFFAGLEVKPLSTVARLAPRLPARAVTQRRIGELQAFSQKSPLGEHLNYRPPLPYFRRPLPG